MHRSKINEIWRANCFTLLCIAVRGGGNSWRRFAMRTQLPSALLATVLACSLFAAPARAQSIRTFVSTAGMDNATCSLASPCRHFSAAVTATAAGGEVDALDAGAYGSFTISQAITIEGQGWSYVAPPSGGAAITINVGATEKVTIHGVSLNGVGVASATGIQFNSGGSLNVQDSVILNFSGDGILFQPNNSSPVSQLYVSNTQVSDNGNDGIAVFPPSGNSVFAVFNNVESINNIASGFELTGSGSSPLSVTILNSLAANNGSNGITAGDGTTMVDVRNSVVVGNQNGVSSNLGAIVTLSNSFLLRNSSTNAFINGGTIETYGNNLCQPSTCSSNFAPPGAPF
jgi:hypothetical protein